MSDHKNLRRFYKVLLLVWSLTACFALAHSAWAQNSDYRLNIRKDFGYNSGGDIRGTFSLEVVGPGEVQSVTFLLDGQPIGASQTAPFKLQFVTTKYPLGTHELSAQVTTQDGKTTTTPARKFQFVTAEEESATVTRIVLPLGGGVLALVVIGLGVEMLALRKKGKIELPLGTPRKYGLSGGTICPRCQRPFPLHWWALNMGITTKYDRCDFCGKWSLVKIRRESDLRAAEQAELAQAQPENPLVEKSADDKLKDMLDDSRFLSQ